MPHKRLIGFCAAGLAILSMAIACRANNIAVSGMNLTNINTSAHTLFVQFNVTWDNSWFLNPATAPGNYDAAWLVVKYHTGDNIWRTATLDSIPGNHVIPGGFAITIGTNTTPSTRAVGVFLHRSAAGSGTATANNVQLKWNYGADGIADSALITAEIHAIEMVYVPSGSFTVGDGTTASWFRNGTNTTPFTITNAGPINAGTNSGFLRVGPNNINTNYTIPATFPDGFSSFYIMKYEVSQDEYVDFLNKTLASGSTISGFFTDRQQFSGNIPNFATPTPYRSALDGGYFSQYLSFICLRPMTEFEYEKACRGPNTPVAGEYAWGTAVAASLQYGLANDGTATEAVATNYNETAGNCWYLMTQGFFAGATNLGPCRVGMFAKAAYNGTTSGRIQSGAGYYGAMDLTGNGLEHVVTAPQSASDTTALNFVGENGNGLASSVPGSWPGLGSTGARGGSARFKDTLTHTEVTASGSISPVSVLIQGANASIDGAIRGVRSAP